MIALEVSVVGNWEGSKLGGETTPAERCAAVVASGKFEPADTKAGEVGCSEEHIVKSARRKGQK